MIRLDDRLDITPEFLHLLHRWFSDELAEMHAPPPWPYRPMLTGFPLWGDAYINRFERFCLPSLLGGNRHYLRRPTAWLVIYFADADFARMLDVSARLGRTGIDVVLRRIPKRVMAQAHEGLNFNWILGVVHKLLIQWAARCGAGFHLGQPDHLYPDGYFAALDRLAQRHSAVAEACLSASESIDRDLKRRYVTGEEDLISIDSASLGDLAYRHLHPQMRAHIMNSRDLDKNMPRSTWLLWVGEDRLVAQRPHHNCAWLSNELCRRAPLLVPNTLDAELPWFMEAPYFAKPDDGLGCVEISGPEKRHGFDVLTWREFALNYWMTVRFSDAHQAWLKQPLELPLTHRPENGWPMEKIMAQVQDIPERLMESQRLAALDYCREFPFKDVR